MAKLKSDLQCGLSLNFPGSLPLFSLSHSGPKASKMPLLAKAAFGLLGYAVLLLYINDRVFNYA